MRNHRRVARRPRRTLELFGRDVTFLEKRVGAALSLAARESFVDGHLDLNVEAPNPRAAKELTAPLRGWVWYEIEERQALRRKPENVTARTPRCRSRARVTTR
jgi:hypothetical protein